MKNIKEYERMLKRNRITLISSIGLFLLTFLLIYLGIENENKKLPDPIKLSDFIIDDKKEEDVYAYIEAVTEPYLFAVYEIDGEEEKNKFYLVMDRDNYLYIIYMSETEYNNLNLDDVNNNPNLLLGITKKIPLDIKTIAISSYNELMENEYLTDDNFEDYVGFVYLDMVSSLNDSSLYYIGSFLTGFFFLILISMYLDLIIKNKRNLRNISPTDLGIISSELLQINEDSKESIKTFLLDKYLVDMSYSLVILKYEDIVWAYLYEKRYNGLLINKCIKIVDKNNNKYEIANTKLILKNKDEKLNEIMKNLALKNSNIVLGFTKDNKKNIAEKIKSLKNQ